VGLFRGESGVFGVRSVQLDSELIACPEEYDRDNYDPEDDDPGVQAREIPHDESTHEGGSNPRLLSHEGGSNPRLLSTSTNTAISRAHELPKSVTLHK